MVAAPVPRVCDEAKDYNSTALERSDDWTTLTRHRIDASQYRPRVVASRAATSRARMPAAALARVASRPGGRASTRSRTRTRARGERRVVVASSIVDEDASAGSASSSASTPSPPHLLRARVYIEHTDAYQVVYHANYFKFLARAREAFLFGDDDDDDASTSSSPRALARRLGWASARVVAVDDVAFASPAVLGDDLVVRTRVVDVGERTLTLRQDVVRRRRRDDDDDDDDDDEILLSAACSVAPVTRDGVVAPVPDSIRAFYGLAQSRGRAFDDDGGGGGGDDRPRWFETWTPGDDITPGTRSNNGDVPSVVNATESESGGAITTVELFESELSAGRDGAREWDVLRWFERNRTDAIGGSASLKALQDEHGVVVVVSKARSPRTTTAGPSSTRAFRPPLHSVAPF